MRLLTNNKEKELIFANSGNIILLYILVGISVTLQPTGRHENPLNKDYLDLKVKKNME